MLTAACSSTTAPPTSAAPAAAALGTLKIGVLIPFTESAIDADIGASQRRAADLYLKLKGGRLAGREIQLVYNDESALDPSVNTVRIQQFLQTDHVQLLLGGAGSPAAYLLRDTAETSKIVYLDTNAGANALTRAVPGCTPSCMSRYTFRVAPSSWQLSEPLGEWASKSGQRDWLVLNADDTFGTESAAAFVDGLAKNGGTAVTRTTVPAKSGADWAKIIATIKAQSTKSVFAAFITEDAEGLLAAWDAAGMRAAGFSLAGPGPLTDAAVLKATKQAAIGTTSAFPWATAVDTNENKTFVDAFTKAYTDDDTGQPLPPDGYAAEMWAAMQVLEEALKTTKGDVRDTDSLIAAVEGVSFTGVGGSFAFDRATHAPIADTFIRVVKTAGGALVNAVIERIGSVKDPAR